MDNPEKEKELVRLYNDSDKSEYSVLKIALHFDIAKRSIVSKLVRMKNYNSFLNKKTKQNSIKKMQNDIQDILGIEFVSAPSGNVNLMKMDNLAMMVDAIEERMKIEQ